jgi:RNase H-like domain found in reverse transcriptase/Reverse transcriptase (RNA-dependent DNA polymerase)/Integrase zinc binding domain
LKAAAACCGITAERGSYYDPLLTCMEEEDQLEEETAPHLPALVPQPIAPAPVPAPAPASAEEDLSWWSASTPLAETCPVVPSTVLHNPVHHTACKSLGTTSSLPARVRFTHALLNDRAACANNTIESPYDSPVHGCANKHEYRINASLTYRASLLKIKGSHKGAHLTILCDDGSAINIISRRKVQELNLHTFTLPDPISVSQFQGTHVDTCTEAVSMPITVFSKFRTTHTIHTSAPFIVMDMGSSFDIILGMPAHYQYDMQKGYRNRDIVFHPSNAPSFTMHTYDKHILGVKSAAVVSHLAASYLQSNKQVSEKFQVWVSLPSLISAPVCSTQVPPPEAAEPLTSHVTAPPVSQADTQPGGEEPPQPAAPHQPAVGHQLSPEQRAEVSKVLHTYTNVFKEPRGINPHLSPFVIKQKVGMPEKPFIRFARRLNLEERAIVELTIQKFLDKGWIEPSDSEWGAPIMFIRKTDGSLRAVVDYRQLNSQSSSDGVKLPLLSACLQSMAGRNFYSKMDLTDGYLQVPMHPDSIHKTAFTTGDGRQFQWLVMPMGLKSAPNHFCRIMHTALKHLITQGVCVVYLDDILIASNTLTDHVQHIQQVLEALAAVDLKAKPSKCQFAFPSVDFLGHHVGPSGIGTQPSKVQAIMSYPVPSTAAQLDSFLGLVGFYSPLLHNLSSTCALLREKVTHWSDSTWTDAHQHAYDRVKKLVSSAPFMHAVDQSLPFHIHLDASKFGTGATLSQDFGKGLQPVAYFSRKLLDYQSNYQNGKRELLSLILACRQWRHWVGGAGVCVHAYTDHSNNALIFSPSFSVTDTTIAGWLLELQHDYPGLTISHISGTNNSAADALSRNPNFQLQTTADCPVLPDLVGCVLGFQGEHMDPIFSSNLHCAPYTSDAMLHDKGDTQIPPIFAFTGAALVLSPNAQLRDKVTAAYDTDAFLSSHKSQLAHREGLYFRTNGALYIPAVCVKLVLELEHDQGGHHGIAETERRIRRKFWFPSMHALIKEYVQGCVVCGRSKPANCALRAPLSYREFADTQWEQVSMDFVCGLPVVSGGFDRVLTVVDRGITKRAHFIKCKSTHTAEHIAQLFLDHIYKHHGLPKSIICDQDPLFMSAFYKGLMSKMHVQLQPTAVYHPQADGQSEVTNRILKTYLVKFCQDHPAQWHNNLWRAEFEYNFSQKTTGFSAFQLDMGRQPTRIEDVLVGAESDVPAVDTFLEQQADAMRKAKAALNRAFQLAAKQHNKHTRPWQVAAGDMVYLSTVHLNIPMPGGCRKFKQPYTGPFKVLKMSSSGAAATLELPDTWLAAKTWNVEYLKPYNPASHPILSDDESVHTLSSIAVQDDSITIEQSNPISIAQPNYTTEVLDASAFSIPPGVTSVGMEAATKVVERIVDHRLPSRGKPERYLLCFKDQPAFENTWVSASECGMFSGFQEALASRQNRIESRRHAG